MAVSTLLLAACTATHDIHGSFVLSSADVDWTATSCSGTGGYSDISEAAGVLVKDGAGKVLATGHLVGDPKGSSAGRCAYTFTVSVPDADFYSIGVSHRGELTYSRDDLAARGWEVGFTLGK